METIVAYSDCIEVTSEEQIVIAYSNQHDFAGIIYDPDKPIFYASFPAKFFHERFPEENESAQLSDNSVVKLSGSVKSQKLLQTDAVPYYMHRKLKLILQHNYILIDGQTWEKEEAYEMEKLNEKNPFALGEVWMTQKQDSFFDNVYGEI